MNCKISYPKRWFAQPVNLIFLILVSLSALAPFSSFGQTAGTAAIQFIYTSDAHYALKRKTFKGDSNVDAHTVNGAMIAAINTIPATLLPNDGGINSTKKAGYVDYLIQSGDIANRMEIPYQTAASSWQQFETDYITHLGVKGSNGKPAQLLVLPGNHDISNAIGYNKPMQPLTDPSAMVNIYNMMLKPATPKTNQTYNYATDKINYAKNIGGVHFMFINLWPDSAERIWMQKDLETVAKTTPVVIFCHDQPTCEAKHFTNPVPPYQMYAGSKFENLTSEHYKEGKSATDDDSSTDIEQRGWVAFLKAHANIKAYFHGNSNYNEFYVYNGPDHDVALNTFRVDSPMKGKYSSKDETKLSFQLITLDPTTQKLTVRECLWNTQPTNKTQTVKFGASKTISLRL